MIKIIFIAGLLITEIARAGFPPTTSKVSGDTNNIVTFNYQFPNFTGTHTGTTISLGVNDVSGGGTGLSTLTAHDVLVGNTTSAVTLISPSTAGFVLTSNGVGADPTFQAVTGTGGTLYGTAHWARQSGCVWVVTTSSSFTSFSANASCASVTVTGSVSGPATNIPGVVLTNAPAGDYLFIATGTFVNTGGSGQFSTWEFNDGSTDSGPNSANSLSGVVSSFGSIIGSFHYAGTATRSIDIRAKDENASSNEQIRVDSGATAGSQDLWIRVYKF